MTSRRWIHEAHDSTVSWTAGPCGLGLSGCVMSEKYEARRRAASTFSVFWRREEKRSAELDSEVKRGKRELSDYEARNRELSARWKRCVSKQPRFKKRRRP